MYIAVRFIEKFPDTHTKTNKVASQGLEFTESNNCSFNFYPNSGKRGVIYQVRLKEGRKQPNP